MRFFEQFPEIIAVMSEQEDGPMGNSTNHGANGEFAVNRLRFLGALGIETDSLTMAGLEHGTSARVVVAAPDTRRVPDCDALVSRSPNVALAIATADCLPVFCFNSSVGAIGVIHAGWQGILGGIIEQVLQTLGGQGAAASRMRIAIGPGIQRCCFAVRDDERGIDNFRRAGYGRKPFATETPDAYGKYFVSLSLIAQDQLSHAGVVPQYVTTSQECTYCRIRNDGKPRFLSWRRDRAKGANMLSVIQRTQRRDPNVFFL